jgi:excisionase family DNA binding protein
MIKKEIDRMFDCISDRWKDQIVFSPDDISIMLNYPKQSVNKLCREGRLEAFKIGKQYRVTRESLYKFIKQCIEDTIIF